MDSCIITIGDEILLGQTVDTNSAWLSLKLDEINIRTSEICSISDSAEAIKEALDRYTGKYSLIMMTGGLGPTKDDITKKVLADYFGMELKINPELLKHIDKLFNRWGRKVSERNRQQAFVPDACRLIKNEIGTAAGMLFEKKGSIVISMPGVPFEMRRMVRNHVMPILTEEFKSEINSYHRLILTSGVPESDLADLLPFLENEKDCQVAFLPSPGLIKLRISRYSHSQDENIEKVNALLHRISQSAASKFIVGYDEERVENIAHKILIDNNLTVSTSESCTAGKIASMLTSISGSSSYFKGGIIAYSNEVKEKELGVMKSFIDEYGAVSKVVVEQMAIRACHKFNSDYSVATSGIAGPTGGTDDKPVGTTWIAVSNGEETVSKKFYFGSDRSRNIIRTSVSAISMLIGFIEEKNPVNFIN